MKMRVKMDINKLADTIIDALNSSKSRYVKENGIGIVFGLNLFLQYLREITQRAIEIDDAVILSALLNIGALLPDDEREEKEIHERAEAIRQGGKQ